MIRKIVFRVLGSLFGLFGLFICAKLLDKLVLRSDAPISGIIMTAFTASFWLVVAGFLWLQGEHEGADAAQRTDGNVVDPDSQSDINDTGSSDVTSAVAGKLNQRESPMKDMLLRSISILAVIWFCSSVAQLYDQHASVLDSLPRLATILAIAVCFWKWTDDEAENNKQAPVDRSRERDAERKQARSSKQWIHRIAVLVAWVYWCIGLSALYGVLFANPFADRGVGGLAVLLVGVFGMHSTSFLFVLGTGAFFLRSASVLAGIGGLVEFVQFIRSYVTGDSIIGFAISLLLISATAVLLWNAADIEIERKKQVRIDPTRGKYATRTEHGPANPWSRRAAVCFTVFYWYTSLTSIHRMLQTDSVSDQAVAIGALLAIGIALVYVCSFASVSGTIEVRPIRALRRAKDFLLFWMSPGIAILALAFGHIALAVALLSAFLFSEITRLRSELRSEAWMLSSLQSHCTSAEISIRVDRLLRHPLFVEAYEVVSQRSSLPEFNEWASTIGDALIAETKRLCGTPDYVRPQFNPKEEYGSRCLIVRIVQRGDSRLIVNGVETDSVKLSLSVDLVQRGDSRLIVNGIEADTKTVLLVGTKKGDATSNAIILPGSYSQQSQREWGFKLSIQLRIVNGIVVLSAGPFSELEGMFNFPKRPPICRIPIMYCGRSVLFTSRTLGFGPNSVEMSHGGQPKDHGVNVWEMSAKYEAARVSRIMPEAMTPAEVRDARLWQEEQLAAALSDGLVKTENWDTENMRWQEDGHPCDDQSIALHSGFIANKEPILGVFPVDHNNNHAIYWDTWSPHAGPK